MLKKIHFLFPPFSKDNRSDFSGPSVRDGSRKYTQEPFRNIFNSNSSTQYKRSGRVAFTSPFREIFNMVSYTPGCFCPSLLCLFFAIFRHIVLDRSTGEAPGHYFVEKTEITSANVLLGSNRSLGK